MKIQSRIITPIIGKKYHLFHNYTWVVIVYMDKYNITGNYIFESIKKGLPYNLSRSDWNKHIQNHTLHSID